MDTLEKITLIAIANIDPKERIRFQLMFNDLKKLVETEENLVVLYECHFKDQTSGDCMIIESYSNEPAFLNHLKLITPISEKYKITMNVEALYIAGKISMETLSLFDGLYPNTFKSYNYQL